jgi:Zn-dependent peptidase ImmA (M78 family)/transcriptional regulator with XRE-family HTH domain
MATVGDMLRLARQRKGFTQKDAAGRLGIVQPVLSRFENGVADPDKAFLLKASQVYSVPRAFFDMRDPVYGSPVSVHPMPRAKADVTARDLDMVTAELNIRVMQLRRFLESVEFQPSSSLPALDVEDYGSPERIAAVVRSHWGIPSGPIKNLVGLVERAGAIVGTSDFGGAAISGMTFRVPGQPPLVLLNSHHPADRMRYTLAHEVGHLVMHRFPTVEMEKEANEFASSLLMPAADIRGSFAARRISLPVLASLKPEWRVSMQSLLIRSKDLGFVDGNQYRYLWQQIGARGWRLGEPPELDFPHEHPSVLHSIIRNMTNLGFTLTDLCALVPIHEADFLRMYGPIDGGPQRPGPRLRVVA